jgi:acyl-CoA reductase-like NAD-dependent aldehyde dehydrogenase
MHTDAFPSIGADTAAPRASFDVDAPLIAAGEIRGTSPADGTPLAPITLTPVDDVRAIVARCREAQRAHAARDVETRAALLRRFAEALLRRGEETVAVLQHECGKLEAEARLVEVLPTADLAAYWCEEGPAFLAPHEPELDAISYPGKRATVERAPRGVVALITPWNFPVAIPLRTIFPALLAGDGVVLKPSEYAPRSGALIAEAAREVYGDDLVALVQGGGDVGAALVAAGVDAVIFTGSVPTGRKVAHAAADALVPVSLELGGKDAAIVLDDADLERTAAGLVWGAFANAGQNCAAIERVYVTPGIAAQLEARVVALTQALVLGRDVGPMTTPAQLALVARHVDAAVAAGARALTGGARDPRPGLWYPPTVLVDVPADAEVLTAETFGPVLPIVRVENAEAALVAANASPFGLTGSVWTRDLERGEELARRLRTGVAMVNNHSFSGAIPSLPWTGVGESGHGVTNSAHALDLLTRPRAILVDASRAKRELWWQPYTPALAKVAQALTTLRSAAGLGAKFRAVGALLGGFLQRWKV